MTAPHIDGLLALERRIMQANAQACEEIWAMVLLGQRRGCGNRPLVDCLTAPETAALDRYGRQVLDSDRTQAALCEWQVRSGAYDLMGIEPPAFVMTITEDPDGSLVLIAQGRGGPMTVLTPSAARGTAKPGSTGSVGRFRPGLNEE